MNESRPDSSVRGPVSTIVLFVGWGLAAFELLTASSGFGLIFLVFAPLPFILAANLQPTRWRMAAPWSAWAAGPLARSR